MAGEARSSEGPSGARRGGLRRRVLIALLVLANLVVFGGAGITWYWADRASSQIATIPEHELPSIDVAPTRNQSPRTFLLIGSDSRDQLPEDFPGRFGEFEGQRADVIMVVRLFPNEDSVQILSIPRDLKVEIPGRGTDKINAAYSLDGPDLMVQVVKQVVGTPIHHYVEMDFFGFASIVDALGGIRMYFPYPARDDKSGLDVQAGLVEMDGPDALAYARSRRYQELRDGRWVTVDPDDFGRIRRQQRVIFAIVEEAKRPSTVTEMGSLIEAFGAHVTADSALSSRALLELAWQLRSIGTEDVEAVALPVEPASEGGIYYLAPREPDATEVLQAFRSGASLVTAAHGPPRILVLNGNGIEGAAADAAVEFEAHGFEVVEIGDADHHQYRTTLVIARPEELARAKAVREELGFGEIVPGSLPDEVDVIVILGSDARTSASGSLTDALSATRPS